MGAPAARVNMPTMVVIVSFILSAGDAISGVMEVLRSYLSIGECSVMCSSLGDQL